MLANPPTPASVLAGAASFAVPPRPVTRAVEPTEKSGAESDARLSLTDSRSPVVQLVRRSRDEIVSIAQQQQQRNDAGASDRPDNERIDNERIDTYA